MVAAQIKMKALVAARLMMGDITTWARFEAQRTKTATISNRRIARSVLSQIGRDYRELSIEIKYLIDQNFMACGYEQLAHLCDEIGSAWVCRYDWTSSR